MAITIDDLRRAGAIHATCLRYYALKSKRNGWARIREWAESEFRGASPSTITSLIRRAEKAIALGRRLQRQGKGKEITGKEERALRDCR